MNAHPGARHKVLELELQDAPLEEPPTDLPARVRSHGRPVLHQLTGAITAAARDPSVRGLVAHLATRRLGLSTAAELRDAVIEFRRSGRPAIAWTETFGELSQASVSYYLASGFDEIWLQPSGELSFAGLAAGGLFMGDALRRLGVAVEVSARHEYKGAPETFTRNSFSEPARESIGRVLESVFDDMLAAVSAARGVPVGELRELVARAPLTATDALAARLVDRLGYRDQVYDDVMCRFGSGASLRYVQRYHPPRRPVARLRRALPGARGVALISVAGAIRLGPAGHGPLGGSAAGSTPVCAALRLARDNQRIAAVVLRVNSPGGSYVASDAIWREVVRCREIGKPVVVSMGDVAASGGYFVSAGADRIVAEPGTLTGSIGVFAGKPVLADLMARAGVGHDAVETSPAARMMSVFRGFTAVERERLEHWLDLVYDDFVGKVASGRGMTRERVHELARGRVWSGADALAHGLVDTLGALPVAVELARSLAGLPKGEAGGPGLVRLPPGGLLRRLHHPASSADPAAARGGLALPDPLEEAVLLADLSGVRPRWSGG